MTEEYAILRVHKSTMPPDASLVVCYEVNGEPVLADERYEDYVVARWDDLTWITNLVENKSVDAKCSPKFLRLRAVLTEVK